MRLFGGAGSLRMALFGGSGHHAEHRVAARAGWGFVSSREDNATHQAEAYGPLPTFTQSVGRAEIYAAAMALRFAPPFEEVIIATDYDTLYKGWQEGRGAHAGAGSKCAEAWKIFWAQAEDHGLQYIQVKKVPAHRPFTDVTAGKLSYAE